MANESALPQLTAQYVQEHVGTVHTYESFGRAIVAAILEQTMDQVAKAPATNNEANIQMEFRVKPTAMSCVNISNSHGSFHVTRQSPV